MSIAEIHPLREGSGGRGSTDVDGRLRARAVAVLGEAPVRWAAESARGLIERVSREVPGAEGRLRATTGVETELLRLLLHLEGGTDARLAVSAEALAEAREAARLGIASVVVSEVAWRLHVHLQDAILDAGGAGVAGRLRALTAYSTAAAAALLAAHAEEDGDYWRDRVTRRREALAGLLGGDPATLARPSVLGLPLHGTHVVAVIAAGSPGRPVADDDPRLLPVLDDLDDLLPGARRAVVATAFETVVWWAGPHPVADDTLRRMAAVRVPAPLRVAVGDPHRGPDGVARSHDEAQRMVAVAGAAEGSRVAVHADALLAATLLADRDAALDLVRRELDGVLSDDPRSAELRRTVLTHLRCNGSRQEAAALLAVAPTTVAYRVDRFEQLRGRRLAERRLEVWAALDVVDRVPALLEDARRPPAAAATSPAATSPGTPDRPPPSAPSWSAASRPARSPDRRAASS